MCKGMRHGRVEPIVSQVDYQFGRQGARWTRVGEMPAGEDENRIDL